MARYNEQFKLQVVQDYISGEGGAKLLGRKYEVPEEKVRTWVGRYRCHGVDGLRPKRSSYSADFKLEVLYRQEREQLSCRQIAILYDIRNPNQVAVWRKEFDAGGLPALENKRRRCTQVIQNIPLSTTASITSEVSDIDTLQALRDENERLCTEVAYLKKLHALIQEKKLVTLRKRESSLD